MSTDGCERNSVVRPVTEGEGKKFPLALQTGVEHVIQYINGSRFFALKEKKLNEGK